MDSSELRVPEMPGPSASEAARHYTEQSDSLVRIDLEDFEEEEAGPVVLLSPKPRVSNPNVADAGFVSEMGRRLDKEAVEAVKSPTEGKSESDNKGAKGK